MRLPYVEWLRPGLGVKRWVLLAVAGTTVLACALLVGVGLLVSDELVRGLGLGSLHGHRGAALLVAADALMLGAVGLVLGVRGVVRFERSTPDSVSEILSEGRLARGPRIVAIGGGNGLAALLKGLKHHTSNLTAVVTVADDGGSSGRLRKDMGVLPPGDIRNCLVALADDESLMGRLFQYRFTNGGLQGHSFGNLFVAALAEVTGDFERAVRESTSVLKVRGRVLPSTLENVVLHAQLQGGEQVSGESTITAADHLPLRVWLTPTSAAALPEALAAIDDADLVVLGPGSVFTSIIPNLLIPEVCQTLQRTRACVAYVCNVMTQPGETDDYSCGDHVDALYRHGAAGLVDVVLVNDTPVSGDLAVRYEQAGARPVAVDDDRLRGLGLRVVHAPLATGSNVFRHDPALLSQALAKLVC